jgi:hypothetical protein
LLLVSSGILSLIATIVYTLSKHSLMQSAMQIV